MERQEVNEKFGHIGLKFSSYYKYSFTFKGESEDGYRIIASYGGNHNDIYRYSVKANEKVRFNKVKTWDSVRVLDQDGEEIFNEYNHW